MKFHNRDHTVGIRRRRRDPRTRVSLVLVTTDRRASRFGSARSPPFALLPDPPKRCSSQRHTLKGVVGGLGGGGGVVVQGWGEEGFLNLKPDKRGDEVFTTRNIWSLINQL